MKNWGKSQPNWGVSECTGNQADDHNNVSRKVPCLIRSSFSYTIAVPDQGNSAKAFFLGCGLSQLWGEMLLTASGKMAGRDPFPCALLFSPLLDQAAESPAAILHPEVTLHLRTLRCGCCRRKRMAHGWPGWQLPSPRLPVQTVVSRSESMRAWKSLFYLVPNHSQSN